MICNDCSRRDFIRIALGGTAAAGLANRFWLPSAAALPMAAKAKSVILLWLQGAPSQLDTFDPKPGSVTGGPTKAIDTAMGGVSFADSLPLLAKSADRFSLIRSLHSNDPNHDSARYLLHTGWRKNETVDHPHVGSLVSKELGVRKGGLPGCITFGGSNESGAGFLPYDYAPLIIEKVENPLEDLVLPKGVTLKRLRERELLLRAQNKSFKKNHQEEMVEAQQKAYDRALEMIRSSHLKAFDISKEKDRLKQAYGETPFGKACLMARRLVGAGVRFVEVTLADWDTHEDNFNRTRELCGQLDPAMSTLLKDLESRGMLDDTIVLCMGEFGRTPYINGNQGRDHFSRAFFAALAGGGIQPGRVVGKTNKHGTEITERPVSVADLYSTLYKQLGIDPEKKYKSKSDRPIQILEGGKPIRELL